MIVAGALTTIVALALWHQQNYIGCDTTRCMILKNSRLLNRFEKKVPVYLDGRLRKKLIEYTPAFKDDVNFSHMIEVLSQHARNMESKAPHGPSCAVVGNSQNLLGSNYGEKIDKHDYVFRMNSAPVATFEKDVGSRTTHHVFSHIFAGNYKVNNAVAVRPYSPETYNILIPLQNGTPEDFNKSFKNYKVFEKFYSNLANGLSNKDKVRPPLTYDNMAKLRDVSNLVVLTPDFLWYVNTNWFTPENKGPADIASTGFLTLILAFHACEKVDVFGFGPNKDGTWGQYFSASKDNPIRHQPGYQDNFMASLEKKGVIRIFRGN